MSGESDDSGVKGEGERVLEGEVCGEEVIGVACNGDEAVFPFQICLGSRVSILPKHDQFIQPFESSFSKGKNPLAKGKKTRTEISRKRQER
jgi:hypothetical protein